MKTETLALSHQALITEKTKQLKVDLSEYCFSCLYLFRNLHHYELLFLEELLFVRGITRDKIPFLMPLFTPEQKHIPFIQSILGKQEIMFPIPEEWFSLFLENGFVSSYNVDDSDYLFHIKKLAHYEGRHLSKKRNLVKQFLDNYEVRVENLTDSHRDAALKVLNQWQNELIEKHETDFDQTVEALNLMDQLKLQGKIYFVDDTPVAFVLGEWLNNDCFVVHFEKAVKEYKGLYQYMLQNFAQSLEKDDSWINLEQDLGELAIRQAKHSYHPDKPGIKYRVGKKVL